MADDTKKTQKTTTPAGNNQNTEAGPVEQSAGDSETSAANSPQQVSGAFLTDCANVGNAGFGCALIDPQTKKKSTKPVSNLSITVQYTDKTSSQPKLTAAMASDPWTIYFPVPATQIKKIAAVQINALVGGSAMAPLQVAATAIGKAPTPVQALAATANVLFVTSEVYQPGAIGFPDWYGITETCAKLGQVSTFIPNAVKLKWTAVLSLEALDAGNTSPNISDFVGDIKGPVINTAGQVIVRTAAELWGVHQAPVITDENGTYIGADAQVWSGSDAAGKLLAGRTCDSWSQHTSGTAAVGTASSLTQWLKAPATASCASFQHIYCLGAL